MPAAAARARPCCRRPVGDHDGDARVEPALGDRVDERLEVAAAAGDQDANRAGGRVAAPVGESRTSPHHQRYRTPRSPRSIAPIDRRSSRRRRADRCMTHRHRPAPTDDDEADAHVERPQHVVVRHLAGLLQPLEDRRHVPGRAIDHRTRCRRGRMRGRFSVMPPPVMCAMPLIAPDASSGRITRQIRAMRRQQRVADRHVRAGHGASHVEPGDVEGDAPGERVAVGVQARRRQPDQRRRPATIARAVDQLVARDDADDEPGDVVFAVGL